MTKILFQDAGHVYTREEDGTKLMSVSHLRGLFDTRDWDHVLNKAAAKEVLGSQYSAWKTQWEREGAHILDPAFIEFLMPHMDPKLFDQVRKGLRAKWDRKGGNAAERGTAGHSVQEEKAKLAGEVLCPIDGLVYPVRSSGKKVTGDNETVDMTDLETGFYPEMLLVYQFPEITFSESMDEHICGIAGQIDKCFINAEGRYSVVGDYKFTEKPLDDFAYSYPNHGPERFSYPFNHMIITKVTGYTIQLNAYGYMLECLGYPPKGLYLHNYHGMKLDKFKEIVLDYHRGAVEEAFNMAFISSL